MPAHDDERDEGLDGFLRDDARRRVAYADAVDRISAADPDHDCLRALAVASAGHVWERWDADDQRWVTLAMLIEILRPGAPTGSLADGDRLAEALHRLISAALGSSPEALCRTIEGAAAVAMVAADRLDPGAGVDGLEVGA